ncbi:MAG: hypothetical protein ACMG50_03820 [Thermomonas sp.]
MEKDELASTQEALTEAAKAVLIMIATMDQRETRMRETFATELQSLRHEVTRVREDVATIVRGASSQIAEEARLAVSPIAVQYERAVSKTSSRLHSAGHVVWIWFAASLVLLLLAVVVGWSVLGYYRHELTTTKAELQNYKDAVPVVQAFYASDATLCNGRLCVNNDSSGPRFGDKRQYHQVKPRQQP